MSGRLDCADVDDAGSDEQVDVAALVAEIEAEVARRRAERRYPEELLARLRTEFRRASRELPLDALAHIETVRPLESQRRVGGRAAVLAKRLVRRAIAWYVRPIAEDQSRFNFAVLRELGRLESELRRLDVPWRRPPSSPPREAGATRLGIDPWEVRRDLLARLGAEAPPGPVLVLECGDGSVCDAVGHRPVEGTGSDPALLAAARARGVRCYEATPLEHLEAVAAATYAVVAAFGLLDVLVAGDLLRLAPLLRSRLRDGGLAVVDGPNPYHRDAPADPADVDVAMVRALGPDAAVLLLDAAGLRQVRRLDLGGPDERGVTPWYAVVARR